MLTKVTPAAGPVTSAIPIPILYNEWAAVIHTDNAIINLSSETNKIVNIIKSIVL